MSVANGLTYLSTLLLSRLLGPVDYGAAAAVLGIVLIGSVPGIALQQVAARRTALAPTPLSMRLEGQTLDDAFALTVATLAVGLLLAPPLTGFLHLSSIRIMLWVAVSITPVPALSAAQGLLQGARRFGQLSVLFVTTAALRLVGAVVAAAAGFGVEGVVAGTALAGVLATWLAVRLTGHGLRSRHGGGRRLVTELTALREVLAVVPVVGGLLLLANSDVLLARHYLDARAAGTYAAGSIVTKGAFWAPQFISVLSFSRLADPTRSRGTLQRAVAMVAALEVGGVILAAALGRPVVQVVLGDHYGDLAPRLWLFALLGGMLALAQLLITAGVAARRRGLGTRVWLCIGAQVALVAGFRHGSVNQIASATLLCTGVLVLGSLRPLGRSAANPASGSPGGAERTQSPGRSAPTGPLGDAQ